MKKLVQYFSLIFCLFIGLTLNAQMAFNQASAFLFNTDIDALDITEEDNNELTQFDYEASKDYLPFTTNTFSSMSGDEDISNFLPFAAPIFGANDQGTYLPIEENNGYFIENTLDIHNSEFIVFSDNSFNEIIVSLESMSQRDIDISIFNVYGKKMANQNTTTTRGFNDISIQVDQLTSGLYTMVVKSDKESLRKKFIMK